jgi:hypothetical protein
MNEILGRQPLRPARIVHPYPGSDASRSTCEGWRPKTLVKADLKRQNNPSSELRD